MSHEIFSTFELSPCLSKSHQVPTILNALQRSVQAVLVGKIQIQDWFGNGIKRAALMNKWILKEVSIDDDERCLLQTDGSFLYLLCKDGLYKVGSGYSGTVRVRDNQSYMLPPRYLTPKNNLDLSRKNWKCRITSLFSCFRTYSNGSLCNAFF